MGWQHAKRIVASGLEGGPRRTTKRRLIRDRTNRLLRLLSKSQCPSETAVLTMGHVEGRDGWWGVVEGADAGGYRARPTGCAGQRQSRGACVSLRAAGALAADEGAWSCTASGHRIASPIRPLAVAATGGGQLELAAWRQASEVPVMLVRYGPRRAAGWSVVHHGRGTGAALPNRGRTGCLLTGRMGAPPNNRALERP